MLEVRGLSKRYRGVAAVTNVSFSIRPGEVLGYIGANGAGKSTTVKMLTGLIEPSAGEIRFHGANTADDMRGFQSRLGYVAEEAHLYPHLSGFEYLQLAGRLRGLKRAELEYRIEELLRLFGLWEDRYAFLASYSKGMRQKILLSSSLLHDPELLILDEPFSGLDVNAALVLRSLLKGLAQRGKMVLYSSHVLEVVEKVATSVLILNKGQVAAHDSVENLRSLMAQGSLEGVFAALTQTEDGDAIAGKILDLVRRDPRPAH
ncbi:MAG: ABC transporter ATP-binding protein [Acidobacteria bacterium]|nr:ABC transporter ATP-binding protein [Acidobacteriota bacterium]